MLTVVSNRNNRTPEGYEVGLLWKCLFGHCSFSLSK